MSHKEAAKLAAKGWNLFVDVDGSGCKKICPHPHAQLGNAQVDRKEVEHWDSKSCWDRYQEVKDKLTAEEAGFLLSFLLEMSGGKTHLQNSSLWDMIRSQSLINHNYDNFEDVWFRYKLRQGQSSLARNIFDEACQFGLEYTFKTHVDTIQQSSDSYTHITTRDGRSFRGKRTICTAPLNTLHSLKFDPPLSPLRQEAVELGHINFMTKIHAVVKGSGMASWSGACYPNNLLYAYGDGLLPNGDTHIVAFGTDERPHFVPERDPEKIIHAFQNFHPMDVKKLVSSSLVPVMGTMLDRGDCSSACRSFTIGTPIHIRKLDLASGLQAI